MQATHGEHVGYACSRKGKARVVVDIKFVAGENCDKEVCRLVVELSPVDGIDSGAAKVVSQRSDAAFATDGRVSIALYVKPIENAFVFQP